MSSQDTTCFLSKNAVVALDRSTISSVNMTDNLSTPAVTPTDTAVGVTDAMALIEPGSATYLQEFATRRGRTNCPSKHEMVPQRLAKGWI